MSSHSDDYSHGLSPIAVVPDVPDSAIADPPPPYPDPSRRHRALRSHHPFAAVPSSGSHGHGRVHSHPPETQLDSEGLLSPYSEEDDVGETTENTPFLLANRGHNTRHSRQRSFSHSSTTSGATSLTQTVFSLFHGDDDDDEVDYCGGVCADCHRHQPRDVGVDDTGISSVGSANCGKQLFNSAGWKRYFAPLKRRVYYKALFHLLVLNFPYGLIAWIYLFVFTVTGATTLIALPLGAILCFLNLLGARAFSRGELYLQTRFHQVHLSSYQPPPLFRRLRDPVEDHESGGNVSNPTRLHLVKEHSFYKNTYAMFSDPTSYQALFYFLVIKPAITLLITLLLIAFGIPLLILILPAPVVLRAVRKIGVWQANIAIEGLYHAVR